VKPVLSINIDEAQEKLTLRLRSGVEMREGFARTVNLDLSNAYHEFRVWNDYNKALLRRIFKNNDEIINEYDYQMSPWIELPKIGEPKQFFSRFDAQLATLNSIQNRMELYISDYSISRGDFLSEINPKKYL
jgi:hypothetical protein